MIEFNNTQAGLAQWVADYRATRKAGNVSLAKAIRANIEREIKQHGLDRQAVYGTDPEAPAN